MGEDRIRINRAPVLTLWAAVVAERMGYDPDASHSLARAVAGLTAQRKGKALGIYRSRERRKSPTPELWIELCGRAVPARETAEGVRAVASEKVIDPASVRRYLETSFGEALPTARSRLAELALVLDPRAGPEEVSRFAEELYERFRPAIPPGKAGWGARGVLDLEAVRALASEVRRRVQRGGT